MNCRRTGRYTLNEDMRGQLKDFYGNYTDEQGTADVIREGISECWLYHGYSYGGCRSCSEAVPEGDWRYPQDSNRFHSQSVQVHPQCHVRD